MDLLHVYPVLPPSQLALLLTAAVLLWWGLLRLTYNLFFHPLSHFPGPRAAACTRFWLAYMELVKRVSLTDLREELHKKYGDVVRIAPNELHFANPAAYNDIYNGQNKWDKDYTLYRAFDMDESFFVQPSYLKSKHNRSLLSNFFSKKSISEVQHLVRSMLDEFCHLLKAQNRAGKSSDLYLGFQCFSADTISNFLFATSFNQLSFPDFRGDVVVGVDIAMSTITLRKFSHVLIVLIRNVPPSLIACLSPALSGLMTCKKAIKGQIEALLRNPQTMDDASHRTIYRELLNPEAIKGHSVPSVKQLQDEAELLFSSGSHTVGTVLMMGVYHLLRNPETKARLVDEIRSVWPVLDKPPSYEELEKLPFLTAVIKEMLRIAPAVPVGLPRVVPSSGAVIAGVNVPGGTVVSQSPLFVHLSERIFSQPREFLPDRWLQPESKALENWLIAFSRGPRSCLGINLAYCELYLTLAYLFRHFDVRADLAKPADLIWSEHFLPVFKGQHLHAYCDPLDK
ncbi:cytochrome P450 [Lactarius quietus]|nr:cytochrome P450 [Lactarius quietus]